MSWKIFSSGLAALTLAIALVSCGKSSSPKLRTVTINNVAPRRDVTGKIIDAHDGCLQFFNGKFYLYGTAYGTNDGYGTNNHYCAYSSPDLEHWTYEGQLFRQSPTGVYYRPYVIFNARTRKYVLWFNWYVKLWSDGRTGVAVSDSPTGPFSIVNTNVHLYGGVTGDGSPFVDDDGAGYYIYTSLSDGGTVRVERMTPDYLNSTGETSGILAMGVEAPVLFRRNNVYYALCGPRCAFCSAGSEAQYLTAAAPLGPYISNPQRLLNRRPEDPLASSPTQQLWTVSVSSANCTNVDEKFPDGSPKKAPMIMRLKNMPFIAGQETWVAQIPAAQGEPMFIWMADRWGSAPDGIKGHDFQFWSLPLQFGTNGDILPIPNVPEWHIDWMESDAAGPR